MSMIRFKTLVHDIIHRCRSYPHRLGAVRLNKVLWFADVYAYKYLGQSFQGRLTSREHVGLCLGTFSRRLRSSRMRELFGSRSRLTP